MVLFRQPSACGALQDCGRSEAEVARPARVEKDPQGRLYLAAEVCQQCRGHTQAEDTLQTGSSSGAARPACILIIDIFIICSDILRPSSAALCVGHLSGRAVSENDDPG